MTPLPSSNERCDSPWDTPRHSTPTPAGTEGSHITWTPDEVRAALDGFSEKEVADVLARWRIEPKGTFEGRSIPRLREGAPFVTPPELEVAHETLIAARALRVQPSRDEKIILEWNAMLASAFLQSGADEFEFRGLELVRSLRRTHFQDGTWWRTEHHRAHATANDLAWLIDAAVDAFELTGDDEWREIAHRGRDISRRAFLGRPGTHRHRPSRRSRFLHPERSRRRPVHSTQGDL